jgi:hypothetical protein
VALFGILLIAGLPRFVMTGPAPLPFIGKDLFEQRGPVDIFRLGHLAGESRGADAAAGNLLAVAPDARVWLAREKTLTEVSFNRRTSRTYWLTSEAGRAVITSMRFYSGSLWLGLSDGRIARRTIADGNWRIYATGQTSPQRLGVAGGSLLAFSQEPAGVVTYYKVAQDRFLLYFSLPQQLAVMPGALQLFQTGWYLGTDLGLFRLERPGTDNMRWEMQGTIDGLSLMTVHDLLPAGQKLIIASSLSQYPRLARNLRLTSYGTFVYQYFQGRWERYDESTKSDLEHFLSVNASNTRLAHNGLWIYDEREERAWTVRGAEDDFFRIVQLDDISWLAAAIGGLYRLDKTGLEYRAQRIVALPRLWIDDLAQDAQRVHILSGRSLYSIPKKSFVAFLRHGVLAADETNRTLSTLTNRPAEIRPAGTQPLSEEEAFIRQITRYLERINETKTMRP